MQLFREKIIQKFRLKMQKFCEKKTFAKNTDFFAKIHLKKLDFENTRLIYQRFAVIRPLKDSFWLIITGKRMYCGRTNRNKIASEIKSN